MVHSAQRRGAATTVTGDSFLPQSQSTSVLRRPFPTSSTALNPHTGKSGLSSLAAEALSESPDEPGSNGPTETAGEILEEEGTPGSSIVERRLDGIEERQKRIEELLVSISRGLLGRA